MKSVYKIQKNVINYNSLLSMIHRRLAKHQKQTMIVFKVSIQKIEQIDNNFKQKCIAYLILRIFPWILKDSQEFTIINLNQQLKQYYNTMVINCILKQNIIFQIFIIYIIKKTTCFLNSDFNNIQTDFTLQSEMCIILYYTFLGLEITDKVYPVILKRYVVKPKNTKQSSNQINYKDSFKSSKNSLFQSGLKSSKKLTKCIKPNGASSQVRYSNLSSNKFVNDFYRKESLSEFTSQLKQNLHVDALPPLRRKKINAKQLQRLNTQPANIGTKFQSPKKLQKQASQSSHLNKIIYSNQLSNSLKTFYPQIFSFQRNSKKVKFNQSFYNFDSKNSNNQVKNEKQNSISNQNIENESLHEASKIHVSDWQRIIQEIRKKTIKTKENPLLYSQDLEKEKQNEEKIEKEMQIIGKKQRQQNLSSSLTKLSDRKKLVLEFNQQNRKSSKDYLKVSTYQDNLSEDLSNFLRMRNDNNKRLTKKSIQIQKDSFYNSCYARNSQVVQLQKINLHANWIINHYKQ